MYYPYNGVGRIEEDDNKSVNITGVSVEIRTGSSERNSEGSPLETSLLGAYPTFPCNIKEAIN
jgi:hypothetical protein